MKLSVLPDERFSCHGCTNCCRYWWNIELLAGERERIERQPWTDALRPAEPWFVTRGGKTFLNHRDDGACVFLNQHNGRCVIHETFGGPIKPLGCQLYPFQISPTFPGEATITTRHDCPIVRKNDGAPHADELPTLRQFARVLELGDHFSPATLCHLNRDQVSAVVEFLVTFLPAFTTDHQRATFLAWTADWISTLNTDELTREALARNYGPLKQLIEQPTASARPGVLRRAAFRTLLSLHLRRDEDVVAGRAGRVGRLLAMSKLVAGVGGFHRLGVQHPAGSVRRAGLFRSTDESPAAFDLLWRVVRAKLESFQFMGQANGGRNLLEGLHSLALLYPLTKAAAKYRAFNRGAAAVEAEDVDYAVGAIEHSFGRQAVLKQPFVHRIETLLSDHDAFPALARHV